MRHNGLQGCGRFFIFAAKVATMKEIIKAIQDRIKSEVSEIKYIDVDYGQLNEANPPVKFPAAIIDLDDMECQQLEEDGDAKVQLVTAVFRITLVWLHTSPSNRESDSRGVALKCYDILGKLHQALQGYTDGEHFNRLQRERMSSRMSASGMIQKDLYYTTTFIDE